MIRWIKKLFSIVRDYDQDHTDLRQYCDANAAIVRDAEQYIRNATEFHTDVSISGDRATKIILIGSYKRRDYVHIFDIHPEEFRGLVEQHTAVARRAKIGRFDMPYSVEASAFRDEIADRTGQPRTKRKPRRYIK